MEARVTSKDIPVGNRNYRLNKMDPRLACYLFSTLAANAENGSLLLSALGKLSKEKFDEIQSYAIRHIQWLDNKEGNTFPTSVISNEGKWVDQDLANSPNQLMDLTAQCVLFNIQPFLESSELTDQS